MKKKISFVKNILKYPLVLLIVLVFAISNIPSIRAESATINKTGYRLDDYFNAYIKPNNDWIGYYYSGNTPFVCGEWNADYGAGPGPRSQERGSQRRFAAGD